MLLILFPLLPPQGFGPRGPKAEEAYIEVPACNMISIYIGYIPDKFTFLGFLLAKHWSVISQSYWGGGGGVNSAVYLRF